MKRIASLLVTVSEPGTLMLLGVGLLAPTRRRKERGGGALVALLVAAALVCGTAAHAMPVEYVVEISVDALHAGAVLAHGPGGAPNFWRLRTEGAFTDNARTDYDSTVTTPNHTTILTSRPIYGSDGHLWGENSGNPLSQAPSVHHPHTFAPAKSTYEYVHSVFDVVHDNGLRTSLYYGKPRLDLHKESYTTYGRLDPVNGPDGQSKIDSSLWMNDAGTPTLINTWLAEMSSNPFHYSFIHFSKTDTVGHASTWDITPGSAYMNVVQEVDGYLGQIFNLVETDPRFAGKTAILLTTDHGGQLGTTGHSTVTNIDNYRIPFYVWGPGVTAGGDLYQMNPQYTDPGAGRPDYSDPNNQPIRNGDMANLALYLLGLPPIPGSTMNADQAMAVVGTQPPSRPYGDAVLADSPIAYWRLNETSGTTAVNLGSLGPAANGTYVGGVVLGVPDLIPYDDDAAARFNGSDARVNVPDHALINTGGPYEDKTVELWFTTADVQSRQVLYEQGGFTRGINIYIEGGMLYAGAWNRAETWWEPIFVSTPIEANATYMVDLVLDGVTTGLTGTLIGYLNGEPFDSQSGMSMLWSHGNDCAIGAMIESAVLWDGTNVSGNGLWFNGVIDDVSLYNSVLSPEQIGFHYYVATVPEPTSLILLAGGLIALARRRR